MPTPVILIIDDDPLLIANLAAELGHQTGYDARVGAGPKALQSVSHGPDAVIAGHRSSGIDGLALLDELHQRDPHAVGLVMTRESDLEATEQARAAAGPLGHLSIPCPMEELLPRLQAGLDRRQLNRQLADLTAALERRDHDLVRSRQAVEKTQAALHTTHTELHAATERLVHAEQLAAVGRVTTGIAYELTRQLALVGYAEALKSRVAHDAELVELADIIIAAQTRLAAMVDEIRDFAATESEHDSVAIRREPADLAAVIDKALAIMAYDRDVRQRTITRQYRARPLIALHHDKFSQVIINLVSNAVQATEPNAVLTIELDIARADQFDQADQIAPASQPARAGDTGGGESRQLAVLTVRDHGCGMSPEVLARLGEPFFTTRGDRGSGLGVGICMRIVEEHGGRLRYESSEGHGTTARITVPLLGHEPNAREVAP